MNAREFGDKLGRVVKRAAGPFSLTVPNMPQKAPPDDLGTSDGVLRFIAGLYGGNAHLPGTTANELETIGARYGVPPTPSPIGRPLKGDVRTSPYKTLGDPPAATAAPAAVPAAVPAATTATPPPMPPSAPAAPQGGAAPIDITTPDPNGLTKGAQAFGTRRDKLAQAPGAAQSAWDKLTDKAVRTMTESLGVGGLASAAVPGAIGAGLGGMYGAIAPGYDENGQRKSRLRSALWGGVGGGALGAGAGVLGFGSGLAGTVKAFPAAFERNFKEEIPEAKAFAGNLGKQATDLFPSMEGQDKRLDRPRLTPDKIKPHSSFGHEALQDVQKMTMRPKGKKLLKRVAG